MVCSVVSIVAIRCATASLSRNPTPKCFWCSVHRFLCPCNSGIACRDPSSKCLWCSVHRFLCLEQWSSVPQQWNSCQNLDFFIPFRSGVWRQRASTRLFRHALPGSFPDSKGVLWLVCLEQLPARPLIFLFGSGVTFGPGRGTAGGCFVTPRQGVFLI